MGAPPVCTMFSTMAMNAPSTRMRTVHDCGLGNGRVQGSRVQRHWPVKGSISGHHSSAGGFAVAGCGDEFGDAAEADGRHPAVDGFVLAGAHLVGLVPDADVAATLAHAAIEGDPGGPVLVIVRAGVGFELLEGAPVLDDQERGKDVAEETAIGLALQLF